MNSDILFIQELAELIKEGIGYPGELRFDTSKPDGMPVKLLDSSPLREMGWRPKTSLQSALSVTYASFVQIAEERTTTDVQ